MQATCWVPAKGERDLQRLEQFDCHGIVEGDAVRKATLLCVLIELLEGGYDPGAGGVKHQLSRRCVE